MTDIESRYLSEGQKQVPGIYGGMGPLAHIDFEGRLLHESRARGNNKDQQHPVWLVMNAPSTPDRTQSLASGNNAAREHLGYFAKRLESMGADFIVMTCNTAHAYIDSMQESVGIPIVSMIDATAQHIDTTQPRPTKTGIMATSGTLASGLYDKALADHGLQSVAPEVGSPTQNLVMDAIYNETWGIKATGANVSEKAHQSLLKAMDWYTEQGSDAVILGCTELSVALKPEDTEVVLFDPLDILAKKTIELVYKDSLDE